MKQAALPENARERCVIGFPFRGKYTPLLTTIFPPVRDRELPREKTARRKSDNVTPQPFVPLDAGTEMDASVDAMTDHTVPPMDVINERDAQDGSMCGAPCYGGPANTRNRGACRDGTIACPPSDGDACSGDVLPRMEVCGNGVDEDCDGTLDNGCSGMTSTCDTAMDVSTTTMRTVNGTTCGYNDAISPCVTGAAEFWYGFTTGPAGGRYLITVPTGFQLAYVSHPAAMGCGAARAIDLGLGVKSDPRTPSQVAERISCVAPRRRPAREHTRWRVLRDVVDASHRGRRDPCPSHYRKARGVLRDGKTSRTIEQESWTFSPKSPCARRIRCDKLNEPST
jgi:hypothetical protein